MYTQRVLLTGGAGFIGSHLAERLLSNGTPLWIVDNLNPFYSPERKRQNLREVQQAGAFEFFEADLLDPAALQQCFAVSAPDVVIHLAAHAGVRPSIEDPGKYVDCNIRATVALLELCRTHKVKKLIFGSSSSVYGATAQVPFREEEVQTRPISPYAATKMSGELLAFTYAHLFDIATVALRFFTVYGPRQRPDLAIHKFTKLIEEGKPVPLYGDLRSGRDYTYVSDIVNGICAAMAYEPPQANGARFDVFNLGNSSPVALGDLVDAIERATGRVADRVFLPAQAGDVPITWADIGKASRLLGYSPKTSLEAGLDSFVAWLRTPAAIPQIATAAA